MGPWYYRFRPICLLWILTVVCSGCSNHRDADPAIAAAMMAIQQAEASPAPQYAVQDLMTARGKLAQAKLKASSGDAELARRFAEQAAVDAQVAEAKAEALRAQSLQR